MKNLGQFVVKSLRVAETSVPCQDYNVAIDYYKTNILPSLQEDKENLVVLVLDTKLKIKGWNLVSIGSINETVAQPREVLRPVIIASGYGFIIMHNHPTGDPAPSEADRRFTNRMREASEIMNLVFVDHIVYGDNTGVTFSFKQSGIL